jgi:hypothetical protein
LRINDAQELRDEARQSDGINATQGGPSCSADAVSCSLPLLPE